MDLVPKPIIGMVMLTTTILLSPLIIGLIVISALLRDFPGSPSGERMQRSRPHRSRSSFSCRTCAQREEERHDDFDDAQNAQILTP